MPPPPQFEAHADVVLVDVTVVSGNGDPVTGLTAADFALEVNGQPRSVHTVQFISSLGMKTVADAPRLANVSSNDGPSTGRLLLFVVDENYLRVGSARAVLRTAERVMAKLPAGDMVGLARLPTGRGGVEFTTDRERIRRALSERWALSLHAPLIGSDWARVTLLKSTTNGRGSRSSIASAASSRRSRRRGRHGPIFVHQRTRSAGEVRRDARPALARVCRSAHSSSWRSSSRLMKTPVNMVLLSEGLYVGRDQNDLINLARLAAQARISFFVVQPDESIFDMDSPRDGRRVAAGVGVVARAWSNSPGSPAARTIKRRAPVVTERSIGSRAS